MTRARENPAGELDAAALLAEARAVRDRAYAPYSGHPVGAVLLDASGGLHRGVNVENASYGLTTCAERGAVSAALAAGAREFRAIAVAGPRDDEPCLPCGSCRQILHEFAPDLLVVVAEAGGRARLIPLGTLLPEPFGPSDLSGRGKAPPP